MRRSWKQWTGLLLSVIFIFAAFAGAAEETADTQELYDLGLQAYAEQDPKTAVEYFRKAADLGSDAARNVLGILYFNGEGVEQSFEKALEYWQMAADQGNISSLLNLAGVFQQGLGVEQSDEKSFEYSLRAADLGNADAMVQVGYSYEFGLGVEQSSESALGYFRMAAALENGLACYWVGYMYENGRAVDQSFRRAAEYYLDSAEMGNPAGQVALGLLYESGSGVEQSFEKAREYYQMAADLADTWGYPEGLYHLGHLYQEGLGVEQSTDQAMEYYTHAAQLGSEPAQQKIRKIAEAGDYGLVQTEGITIPDCTEKTAVTFAIPENEAMSFVRNLKAGWNLGNTFDAKDDGPGDPNRDYETYWSGARTTRELLHAVKQAGFSLIRIPVSWHNHLLDDDFTIDPAWLARVKEVVDWAVEEDLYVIINIHHDNEKGYIYPDPEHCDQSGRYITAIWTRISEAFTEYDEHLIFESMNEPRLAGTEHEWDPDSAYPDVRDAMECINQLNRKFVDTVRASGGGNAVRWLIVPGYCGSCGGAISDVFDLPADDRLIVEVHAYTPYPYALDTASPDSSFDLEQDTAKKDEITGFMDSLYRKFIAQGIPVILDEFGALKKNDSDLQGRVNYAAFYTAMAGARGIPVVWWDNSNFTGNGEKFGLIDRNRLEWVYPDIALAIVKNSGSSLENE